MRSALPLLVAALALVTPPVHASDSAVTPPSAAGASAPTYLRTTKAANDRPAPTSETASGGGSIVRTALALLVLGGLAGAALWMKRRRSGGIPLSPSLDLEVVSKTTLGPRSHLALVRLGGEAILLGITEQTITALRSLPASELNRSAPDPGGDAERAPTFSKAEAPTRRAIPAKPVSDAGQARVAFQDLLERASQNDARRRAEARRYAESLHREAAGGDEEPPDSGPRASTEEDDEGMPAHLRIALNESRGDAFGEPDGQAAELVRRFRGRGS